MTRRGMAVLVLLVAFGAAAGGCAVADTGAFNRLQDDMVSMKREMAALRAASPPSASPAPPAASPPGKAEGQAEQTALRKAVADLRAETMGIRDDLAATATRAEETRLSLQRDISHLNGKTDDQAQALAAVRGKLSAVDDLGRRVHGLEEKVGRLAAAAEAAPPRSAPASAPVVRDWKSPEDMYDYALGLIKGGETRKGREVLGAFAARYPEHRLMANVHYWRGESFYAEKDYENAILAFQDVVDRYPGGDKAPDAMYKQGLSFLSLKDVNNARLLFELIRSKYPKSPAADKAAQKLSELK